MPRSALQAASGVLQQKVMRRLGLVVIANTLARGLAFGFFILAARWLSEAEYGLVRSALAWATLLCVLTAPFSLAWTRAIASAHDDDERRRQTAAGLLAFGPLLLATLLIAGIWSLFDPVVQPWTLVMLVGLSVFYAVEGLFKGWMAFRVLAIYLLSGNLLQLAALALLRWLRPDLLTPTLVGWLYGLAYVLPLLWAGARLLAVARPHAGAVRAMITASLGLVLFNSANSLLINIDLVLLGYLADTSVIGYYGVAKTMLSLVLVIAQSVFAVFLPMSSSRDAQPGLRSAVMLVAAGTLLPVLAAVVFAEPLVLLIFTERYLPAVPALRLLMLGGWCYLLLSVLAARLLSNHNDAASRRVYLLVAAVHLGLCLLLIPRFGAEGAAGAFLVACTLGALVAFGVWRRSVRESTAL